MFVEAMANNPTKTYVLLSGNAGAPNLEGRITAVRAVLDQTDLEYVTTLFCNDDAVLGATLIEDQLTAMPDLGGIFFIGGWPLFGDVNAMPQFLAATAAGTLKAVSWDTLWMQLPLLENGTVQGLIGQKYFGWGYDGIGIMYDHVKHGIALPPFIDSGFDLLTTPEQAVEFAKKWETQDFVPEGAPSSATVTPRCTRADTKHDPGRERPAALQHGWGVPDRRRHPIAVRGDARDRRLTGDLCHELERRRRAVVGIGVESLPVAHVSPLAVLVAEALERAAQLEAERLVERHAGLVGQRDDGHDGVVALLSMISSMRPQRSRPMPCPSWPLRT